MSPFCLESEIQIILLLLSYHQKKELSNLQTITIRRKNMLNIVQNIQKQKEKQLKLVLFA